MSIGEVCSQARMASAGPSPGRCSWDLACTTSESTTSRSPRGLPIMTHPTVARTRDLAVFPVFHATGGNLVANS